MMNSELRILFIVDAIQGRNGVGTYFQDLTSHLGKRVARVELVAPNLQSCHPCQGMALPMPGDATQQVFLPRMRQLTLLAMEMKPQVIVVPGPGLFALAGFWLAGKLGVPVCMTHQTDYSQLVNLYWKGTGGRIAQALLHWTNLFMFRGSTTIATVSRPLAQQLRQRGITNPHLVGTPLAPQFINAPIIEPKGSVTRILFVGRLAAEKNLPDFLQLAAQRPDLEFSIVGDGPLRHSVQEQAQRTHNLQFLGWCSRECVQQQLDLHDLLILPSSVEAFGTVALEAMARKRLVLTTPACGINDWKPLAKGLLTMNPGESLIQAVQRIESLGAAQRHYICQQAYHGARSLNQEAIEQWLSVLQITANKAHLLPRRIPSATFALLRRLAAYQT